MKYFILVICLCFCSCQPKFEDSVEVYNEIHRGGTRLGVGLWNTGVRTINGTKKALDKVTEITSPNKVKK